MPVAVAAPGRPSRSGGRTDPAAPPRLALIALLLGALAVSACSPGIGSVPAGFERRTAAGYEVLIPTDWDTVDDADRVFQAADPASATPMTVRIVVASRRVPDVDVEADDLRAHIPELGESARLLDERRREVPGATGAVQMTSEAVLRVAATGEVLQVRLVDLLARGRDGHVVAVKVQGPAEDFDQDLADTILSSLTLVTSDT